MAEYSTGWKLSAYRAVAITTQEESRDYWQPPKVHRSTLNKDRRQAFVDLAMERLREYKFSRWEHEAKVFHELRLCFIAGGFHYTLSESEAYEIVRLAFVALGRGVETRPTFEQGQPEYTVPREHCQRCGCALDEDDIAARKRYCSSICKDASKLHNPAYAALMYERENRAINNDKANWAAPPRECAYCKTSYRSADHEQKYCSVICSARAQPDYRPDRQCKVCSKTFRPENEEHWLCSFECSGKARRTRPDKTCPVCKTIFRPHTHEQITCSRLCHDKDRLNRLHHHQCIICEGHFTSPKSKARFCCKKCENRFYRAKANAGP